MEQISAVDWVVQFDPPDDPRDYIHRVGRTARGADGKGRSLMFLQPSEVGFLKHLKEARIPLVEFEVPSKKILNVQSQLEKLIGQNYYLNMVRNISSLFILYRELLTGCQSLRKMGIDHISKHMLHTVSVPYSMCISWIWSRLLKALDFQHHHALISRWVQVWGGIRRLRGVEIMEVNPNNFETKERMESSLWFATT